MLLSQIPQLFLVKNIHILVTRPILLLVPKIQTIFHTTLKLCRFYKTHVHSVHLNI
jgi:hypothetical protein